MTSAAQTKECACCGITFTRNAKDSEAQWSGRAYCCKTCSNRSHAADPIHLRFWRRVERVESGCWIWRGSKDGGGYGAISTSAGMAPAKAHRISWEMRNGPIPEGVEVCHSCDTPACVNPDHLWLGTHKQNMQDMSAKGRVNPVSILNLRPGVRGTRGAGPYSIKEKALGTRNQ